MKIVKWIFITLFILPFAIGISTGLFNTCTEEGCNPIDYARITDVDYKAVVVDEPGCRGKIVVTERLTFDIHAASENNLFWELWRDLCEQDIDGAQVRYNVLSVKQILDDGTEIEYEESDKLYWDDYDYVSENPTYGPGKWFHSPGPYNEAMNNYECVMIYVDGLYREEVVFEIQYEMYNAALRYGDCSDLYISMFSEDSVYDLESFRAEILFADEDMPSKGNYQVTTYGTSANDFPVEESDTLYPGYHTFIIDLDEDELDFTPYSEFIEFDLVAYGKDKHIFTEHASMNYYYDDPALGEILAEQEEYAELPAKYRTAKIIVFIIVAILSVLVIVYTFYRKKKVKSKYQFYKPVVDYEYYREIPSDLDPKFASALVFSKHKEVKNDADIYSSLLLSLTRKGYIEIKEVSKKEVYIWIRKCPDAKPRYAVPAQPEQPMLSNNQNYGYMNNNFGNNGYMNNNYANNGYIGNNYGDNSYMNNGYTNNNYMNNGYTSNNYTNNGYTNNGYTNNGYINNGYSNNNYMNNGFVNNNFVNSGYVNPANNTLDHTYSAENKYADLTTTETRFFNLIVRHARGNGISMEGLSKAISIDYANTDKFLIDMKNSVVNVGIEQGYLQKADYNQPRKSLCGTASFMKFVGWVFLIGVNLWSATTRMDYVFGAYTIFAACCLFSSWYLKKEGRKLVLLTQFGEDEYAKWRGLYNFLNSNTLMNERTYIDLPLWEKYLVYATAFGISTKVTKAIELRCPEQVQSTMLSNNYYRSGRIRISSRGIRSSVRTGSSVARGGGGGGYGGGGRGGGGGGGGH